VCDLENEGAKARYGAVKIQQKVCNAKKTNKQNYFKPKSNN
jgi:hypothetical protein